MNYRLTLHLDFDELDDVEARKKSNLILWTADDAMLPVTSIKLQEIFDDKQPRKVNL